MDKTKITFDEVWELAGIVDLPIMNSGTGETDKESIIVHGVINRDKLFMRDLGNQINGFYLTTFIQAVADWNKAKGEYKGAENLKSQFRVLLGVKS